MDSELRSMRLPSEACFSRLPGDISQIAYGTSKAAINYMTKLTAVHEARHNIRCNAVLPGMTATDAVQNNLTDNFRELFLKHTPIRRHKNAPSQKALLLLPANNGAGSGR